MGCVCVCLSVCAVGALWVAKDSEWIEAVFGVRVTTENKHFVSDGVSGSGSVQGKGHLPGWGVGLRKFSPGCNLSTVLNSDLFLTTVSRSSSCRAVVIVQCSCKHATLIAYCVP